MHRHTRRPFGHAECSRDAPQITACAEDLRHFQMSYRKRAGCYSGRGGAVLPLLPNTSPRIQENVPRQARTDDLVALATSLTSYSRSNIHFSTML